MEWEGGRCSEIKGSGEAESGMAGWSRKEDREAKGSGVKWNGDGGQCNEVE